jgi:hypothetical protein
VVFFLSLEYLNSNNFDRKEKRKLARELRRVGLCTFFLSMKIITTTTTSYHPMEENHHLTISKYIFFLFEF